MFIACNKHKKEKSILLKRDIDIELYIANVTFNLIISLKIIKV